MTVLRLYRAAAALCLGLTAAGTPSAKPAPESLSPEKFDSAVEWINAVNRASSNRLLSALSGGARVANAGISLGASELEWRSLSPALRQFDRNGVNLTRVVPEYWTKGEYGVPLRTASGYAQAHAMILKALIVHCRTRNGELLGASDSLWFCAEESRPLYVAEIPSSGTEDVDVTTILEPKSATYAGHFSETSERIGFRIGGATRAIAVLNRVIPGFTPGVRYVSEIVGELCPQVARELKAAGVIESAVPHKGVASAGSISSVSDSHTFCLLDLHHKTPKALFNPNYTFESQEDVKNRSIRINEIMARHCTSHAGSLVDTSFSSVGGASRSAWFCKTDSDHTVRFMYIEGAEREGLHRLNIAEPRSVASAADESYLSLLRKFGWKTESDQFLEERKRKLVFERAKGELNRRGEERSAKQKIGARLCQNRAGFVYIGFVEAKSPDSDKVQIRVSDAHSPASQNVKPGGFQPSIIWDHPDRWDMCE